MQNALQCTLKTSYPAVSKAVLIAGILFLYSCAPARPELVDLIEADTAIDGDLVISSGQEVTFRNGAWLRVDGSLEIAGKLGCDGGPMGIEVSGDLSISGELNCQNENADEEGDGYGIQIVARSGLRIEESSQVTADGSIQIVDDISSLAGTQEAIDAVFDEVLVESDEPFRIGPIAAPDRPVAYPEAHTGAGGPYAGTGIRAFHFALIDEAHAQPAPIVLSGSFRVIQPRRGKRVVLFSFSGSRPVTLSALRITGPDGENGRSELGHDCNARGRNGKDAWRMRAIAHSIQVDSFYLTLGSGGRGGHAETRAECEGARATAGDGGEAGNMKMAGRHGISVNTFVITPGAGGNGGEAGAYAKYGDPGRRGYNAAATGGNGADNDKVLTARGNVSGTVQIGDMRGGFGGKAEAIAGKGGDGDECGKNGGDGGTATATGGDGGSASVGAGTHGARTAGATDTGGDGGDAIAKGGDGGKGGDCDASAKGGDGGQGGDASAKGGALGTATNPGADGTPTETPGNGGDGGSGCPEGQGGSGGAGTKTGVAGNDGADGNNLCPPEQQQREQEMQEPG